MKEKHTCIKSSLIKNSTCSRKRNRHDPATCTVKYTEKRKYLLGDLVHYYIRITTMCGQL